MLGTQQLGTFELGESEEELGTYVHGQSQALIVVTSIEGFAQAQALVVVTIQSYGQAQAQVLAFDVEGFGQAQADILAVGYGFGQTQTNITQTYQAYAQAEAQIVITVQGYGQAQAQIIAFDIEAFSQAQGQILQIYQSYAQAQAWIEQTYFGHGQSQAEILAGIFFNSYGQAQADIKAVSSNIGQSNALIDSSIKVKSGNAQGYISKSGAYGQAAALIVLFKSWAQAQAQIKNIRKEANAQARAFIINKKKQGQAQARIKAVRRGFGQSQGFIDKGRGQGQAQAKILSFKTQQWAQAQGYMFHVEGVGHVNSYIIQTHPAPNQTGGNLTFPGSLSTDGGVGEVQNQLSPQFAVEDGINVTIRLTQALNDGGNIGVMTVDGAENYFVNSPVINTSYTFSFTGPRKRAIVYSWDNDTYRPGLTGIGTYAISGGPFAQARAVIRYRQFPNAQAEASILRLTQGKGQAKASILATINKFAQAQATVIDNRGYGQANALIDDGITTFYLQDTFSRLETLGSGSIGTPDLGPDWVYYFGSAMEPVEVDGSEFVFHNNVFSDGDDEYGWAWPVSEINQRNIDYYLDIKVGSPDIYFEVDVRQGLVSQYVYAANWADGVWDWNIGNSNGGSSNEIHYELEIGEYYRIRLQAIDKTAKFKIWPRSDPEPDGWLIIYSSPTLTDVAGGVGFYLDNDSVPHDSETRIDNINAFYTDYPFKSAAGHAQAFIVDPQPERFAQAQGFIAGQFRATGQARAKILGQTRGYGQAQARLLWNWYDYTFETDEYTFNSSNDYQHLVLNDFPEAYYIFNEPLLGHPDYLSSNMAYKDIVWDNLGRFDLTRTFGITGHGPYGTAWYGDHLYSGIPGTEGDEAIVSLNFTGTNWLQRTGLSTPLTGNGNWTVEFWFKPLELPANTDQIILIGANNPLSSGAVRIDYDNGVIKVDFTNAVGGTVNGPVSGPLILNEWNHVVFYSFGGGFNETTIFLNTIQGTSTFQTLVNQNNTVWIHQGSGGNQWLMDELAIYDYGIPLSRIPVHYFAGIALSMGLGHAQAYIIGPQGFGQAQADIKVPWKFGQAQALIQIVPRKYAQAQAYIKGYNTGQAQALITRAKSSHGQSQASIFKRYTKSGQAVASITTTNPVGQARAIIASQRYRVSFNGYQLPGYAQEESMDSVETIKTFQSPYRDMSFMEYQGLENKLISVRLLVIGQNYLDCKNQIELAGTLVRSNRAGFAPLYIQHYDRHYEALTKSISTEASTANVRTSQYSVQFEAKPWLISDTSTTISGVSNLETTGRTLDNGGWTPATVIFSGTDVTVSGYTATGDFTGYITVSGAVTNYAYTNEDLYIGPGVTHFEVTGATNVTITYNDRWYL